MNKGLTSFVLVMVLCLLLIIILLVALIFYNEKIILTKSDFFLKKYFLIIPLKTDVFNKNDIRLSLIPKFSTKRPLGLHTSFNWLIFINENQQIPILAFKESSLTSVRQYIDKLIEFGINLDELASNLIK